MNTAQGKNGDVVVFGCAPENGSWELTRNKRLICYAPSEIRAIELMRGFVAAVRRRGGRAEFHISRSVKHKGRTGP